MDDLLQRLAETLDVEETLSAETVLESLEEWDSLGALTVVSMFNDELGVTVTSEQVAAAVTVGDLLQLAAGQS
jgi:acyl carrier protein